MTAVCLKARNSVETDVKTWSSIFTSFNTYTKSCLFVKQLTRTCISTILHLRKVLPDYCFESINFEGMTLKLLKSRRGENYVSKIEQWLEGAFEAVEKKYLKRLMLDIQDVDSNMTLEIYTMTFNYNKERETINPFWSATISNKNSDFTISNTKLSVIRLLQMCHAVTQTYGTLPPQVKLSVRLSYYENTPEDYQPTGYMSWEPVDPEFPKQARSIEIGTTSTQHHFFKLLNKSCLNDKFLKEMKDQLETNEFNALTVNNHHFKNIFQEWQTKAKRELCFDNSDKFSQASLALPSKVKNDTEFAVIEKTSSIFGKNHLELLNDNISKRVRATKTEKIGTVKKFPFKRDLKVRCACMSTDKSETMFPCNGCRFLVHAECFGILEFDSSKKIRFYCHLCHQTKSNFKCHDKVLVSLKCASDQQLLSSNVGVPYNKSLRKFRNSIFSCFQCSSHFFYRTKLSILRRVLRYCTLPNVTKITLKKIEKITGAKCFKNVANIVLNKMIEIGVAIPQGKKKNYIVNTNELSKKLIHYFYKVTQKSIKTSENFAKENDVELCRNKNTKKPTAVLQEFLMSSNQTSQ